MPTIRCVLCAAKQPQDTVFQFPRHAISQMKWMAVCNVVEVRPSMGVCVRHFERSEINTNTKVARLSQGAVPSLHPSSERLEGKVLGCGVVVSSMLSPLQPTNILSPLQPPMNPLQPMKEPPPYTPRKPVVVEPIPEATKDVTLPVATYARLLAAKTAMKTTSLAKTVERLTTWFMRKESRKRGPRRSTQRSELASDLLPGTELGAPYPFRSLVSDSAPRSSCRNLTEAEVLQEMDVQLASEDDPGAGDAGADTTAAGLCDGSAPSGHWDVRSAVISEPQLCQLLLEAPTHCPSCMQLVQPAINRISLSYSVTWVCQSCGIEARLPWHSTSGSGQVTTFDTAFAAAITLSGCSLPGVQRLLDFVNMGRLNSGVFHRITDTVVSPVIGEQFRDTLEANRQKALAASPGGLVVSGCYQVDTPDFSTSFGTYTLVDHATGHIVAQSTVPHQGPRSPTRQEELQSVRQCLADLRRAEVSVKEFVSDRLVGVKRLIGSALPSATFSYDVWDAARHVEKRLNEYATKSGYKKLKCWVGYLKNHFWWCAKTAEGDSEVFRKLWVMAVDHVVNVHVTTDGLDSCHHGELGEEERNQEWLTPGSAVHEAVQEVVLDDQTLNMAEQVVRFRHDSRIEVYRAADRQYAPKQEPCTLNRVVARKQAAVLDYSAHICRPFAENKDGSVRHIRAHSRAANTYLTRPVRAAKTYPHVKALLAKMAELRRKTTITEPMILGSAR